MKLKNIKETFDSRTIKPSAGSWDALASRLDAQEKKPNKPVVVYWLGAIAAVFIAAMLIYPALNSSVKTDKTDVNQIVSSESKVQEKTNETQNPIKTKVSNEVVVPDAQISSNEPKEVAAVKNTAHNAAIKKQETTAVAQRNSSVNKKSPAPLNQTQLLNSEMIKESSMEFNNNVAVANTANLSQPERELSIEEEMELLLKDAMNKAEPTAIVVKTVDADRLLREAEWDIKSDERSRLQKGLQNGLNFLKIEAFAIVEIKN